MHSIYFTDPNGIALEASWWVIDATGRDSDYGDRNLFADADPVPAFRELVTTGQLDYVPATRLVERKRGGGKKKKKKKKKGNVSR